MAKEPRELVMQVVEDALEAKGFPPGHEEDAACKLDMAWVRKARLKDESWHDKAEKALWLIAAAVFGAAARGWIA